MTVNRYKVEKKNICFIKYLQPLHYNYIFISPWVYLDHDWITNTQQNNCKKQNKSVISRNDQINDCDIASLALFIAHFCVNVMSVMHFNVMSWDNGKLVASKLIHGCSFHWVSPREAAAANGTLLRVANISFSPSWVFVSLYPQMGK